MAGFSAHMTCNGWVITGMKDGKDWYLQSIYDGEYKFTRNSLFAKTMTTKTAEKHLSILLEMPFKITERTAARTKEMVTALMGKGWSRDEAVSITNRIYRQYQSNVVGLSINAMVKMQCTKEEFERG